MAERTMVEKNKSCKSFFEKHRVFSKKFYLCLFVEFICYLFTFLFFVLAVPNVNWLKTGEKINLKNYFIIISLFVFGFFTLFLVFKNSVEDFKSKKKSRSVCIIIGIILLGGLSECGALFVDNFLSILENSKMIIACIVSFLPLGVPIFNLLGVFCDFCEEILRTLFDFQNGKSNSNK